MHLSLLSWESTIITKCGHKVSKPFVYIFTDDLFYKHEVTGIAISGQTLCKRKQMPC